MAWTLSFEFWKTQRELKEWIKPFLIHFSLCVFAQVCCSWLLSEVETTGSSQDGQLTPTTDQDLPLGFDRTELHAAGRWRCYCYRNDYDSWLLWFMPSHIYQIVTKVHWVDSQDFLCYISSLMIQRKNVPDGLFRNNIILICKRTLACCWRWIETVDLKRRLIWCMTY